MNIEKGNLVYSIAGRDKGGLFLVLSADEKYVYLADGDTRLVSKPKKKKLKHINRTNTVLDMNAETISDSWVRKALSGH